MSGPAPDPAVTPAAALIRPYRPLSLALLAASIGCLLMIALRVLVTGHIRYVFLLWNLFLAWIPYALALLLRRVAAGPAWPSSAAGPFARVKLLAGAIGLLWLFFYPNAPYILTDFIHVIRTPSDAAFRNPFITDTALLWYDILLNSAFAFVGHIIGLISLLVVHRTIRERAGSRPAWIFVAAATVLGGYGIYLGRFERFNSWQVFSDPPATLRVALVNLINLKAVLFSLAFAFFIFLTYLIVWSLHETGRGE